MLFLRTSGARFGGGASLDGEDEALFGVRIGRDGLALPGKT
jgi:hypothetical protein